MSPWNEIAALALYAEGPSDGGDLTPVSVSPGLPGFFAMAAITLAVVLLLIDFSRRVRRIQARDRVEQREQAARRAQDDAREADDQQGQSGSEDRDRS